MGSAGINAGNTCVLYGAVDEKYDSFMEYCLHIRATMISDSSKQLGFLWRKGKCYKMYTRTDSRACLYNKDVLYQVKCRVQQNIDYK